MDRKYIMAAALTCISAAVCTSVTPALAQGRRDTQALASGDSADAQDAQAPAATPEDTSPVAPRNAVKRPSESGPRWRTAPNMASRRLAATGCSHDTKPAMPHMAGTWRQQKVHASPAG